MYFVIKITNYKGIQMKRTLSILCLLLAAVMVFVSCGEDPFFYNVEFDSDGGSKVETQTVKSGEKAKKPETPVKEGYNFVDWYDGESVFDFDTEITKDYKLTAKWTSAKPTYTVTFDANGAADTVPAQTVEEGGKATKPDDPTRSGYELVQWNKADGTKFDFDKDTVTGNITLTAVWEKVYTVGQAGPAGGTVIYDVDKDNATGNADGLVSSECGWRYLELAPADADTGAWKMDNLGSGITTTDGIGCGEANTKSLLDSVTESATGNSWSKIVKAYKVEVDGTSYTGWYLPSEAEFRIAASYFDIGDNNYWTSKYISENTVSLYNGYAKNFYNQSPKNNACRIRLMRKF